MKVLRRVGPMKSERAPPSLRGSRAAVWLDHARDLTCHAVVAPHVPGGRGRRRRQAAPDLADAGHDPRPRAHHAAPAQCHPRQPTHRAQQV